MTYLVKEVDNGKVHKCPTEQKIIDLLVDIMNRRNITARQLFEIVTIDLPLNQLLKIISRFRSLKSYVF